MGRDRHIWFRPPGADLSRCVRCEAPRTPAAMKATCPGRAASPAPPADEARP